MASFTGHELIRVYNGLEEGSDLDWVNPDSLFGSDVFVSAPLVNPKRTASDMAPVLGIRRS